MIPNTKKTRQLLIATQQKFTHMENPLLILFLNNSTLQQGVNEKLLGVIIGKHLSWDNHIDYIIHKLNSRLANE